MARSLDPILAIGLAAAVAVHAWAADPYKTLPDVAVVNAAIDREGPRTVLWDRLFANAQGEAFDTFLTKVETGDPAWVQVAARLRPTSDAGVSLMLDQALTLALPKATALVLQSITSYDAPATFSMRSICSGSTFLDDEPRAKVLAWFETAERSLIVLQVASLDAKRTECLSALREGRKAFVARRTTPK